MAGAVCSPGSRNMERPNSAVRRPVLYLQSVVQTCAARWYPPAVFRSSLRVDAGLGVALLLRR